MIISWMRPLFRLLRRSAVSSHYGVIYLDWCFRSGKGYVGQTTRSLKERWYHKVYYAGRNTAETGCRALYAAIRKHSASSFETFILAEAETQVELDQLEIHFIKELGTLAPDGYNLQIGGCGGKATIETRLKQSRAQRGRIFSKETLRKMSEAKKGHLLSEEHRLALSAASKGRPKSDNHKLNMRKPKSAAHRAAISLSHTGKSLSAEHRKAISETKKRKAASGG